MAFKCALSRLRLGLARPHISRRLFSRSQCLADTEPVPQTDAVQPFGGHRVRATNTMEFIAETAYDGIPMYRVLNKDGTLINESEDPKVQYSHTQSVGMICLVASSPMGTTVYRLTILAR
ncbi:unnamed protein product [Ixodes pacificus]